VNSSNATIALFKATQTITVTAKSASTQISDLIAKVQALPGVLSGYKSALVSKLQNAQAALNANNIPLACSWMNDFIQDVAGQSGKKLTVAQSTDLQGDANRIKAVIGCK
jgi:hypothetical protein